MTVRTALETIAIGPPDPGLEELVAASFSPKELTGLDGAPSRSIAGRLALKRAAAALVRELLGVTLPLGAIRVHRAEGGRPSVAVDPSADPRARELCGRMRVSISHSRRTAVGAAAVEEVRP